MSISWSAHVFRVFLFIIILLDFDHIIIDRFQHLVNLFIYEVFVVFCIHLAVDHLGPLIILEVRNIIFCDKTSIKGWFCADNWWPLWGINANSYMSLFHHTKYLITFLCTNNLIFIGNISTSNIVVDVRISCKRNNIVFPPT